MLGASLVVVFAGAAALGSACSSSSGGGGTSDGGSSSGSSSGGCCGSGSGSTTGSSSGGGSGSSSGSGDDSGSGSSGGSACTPAPVDGGSFCYSGPDALCTNVSPASSACKMAGGISVSSCPMLNAAECNALVGCCKGPNGQGSTSPTGETCYYVGFGGGGCCPTQESECTGAGGTWSTTP
ncbi:MAG: hypothetical protein ABSE49_12980 [Polyangiaceae bacterium]